MAQYLLGENTLVELCYKDTPSQRWLDGGVSARELYTSVIAVAAARETIQALAKGPIERNRQLLNLKQVIARLRAGGMTVLPFEVTDANEWVNWRWENLLVHREGKNHEIGQDTRMIIATAAARGLQLVEPDELYHLALMSHGLALISL